MRRMSADKIRDIKILRAFMKNKRYRKEGQDESDAIEKKKQQRPALICGNIVNHRKDSGDIDLPSAKEFPCGSNCACCKTHAQQNSFVFCGAKAFYKAEI